MTLDDRIYCLQRTALPDDLQAKLTEADIAYLQDRDHTATQLVTEIESECQNRGITINVPKFAFM
jgi:hypothetical protein